MEDSGMGSRRFHGSSGYYSNQFEQAGPQLSSFHVADLWIVVSDGLYWPLAPTVETNSNRVSRPLASANYLNLIVFGAVCGRCRDANTSEDYEIPPSRFIDTPLLNQFRTSWKANHAFSFASPMAHSFRR
jgi:hypothetical protein